MSRHALSLRQREVRCPSCGLMFSEDLEGRALFTCRKCRWHGWIVEEPPHDTSMTATVYRVEEDDRR